MRCLLTLVLILSIRFTVTIIQKMCSLSIIELFKMLNKFKCFTSGLFLFSYCFWMDNGNAMKDFLLFVGDCSQWYGGPFIWILSAVPGIQPIYVPTFLPLSKKNSVVEGNRRGISKQTKIKHSDNDSFLPAFIWVSKIILIWMCL